MPLPSVTEAVSPHPALRPYLARNHVGFVDVTTESGRWVEAPNGMVTIILNLAEAFGGHPTAFVAGLSETYEVIERDGPIECLDLKLTPPGARRLLGMPLQELTGAVVALRDVLGPQSDGIVDRLRSQSTWASRADLVDSVLLRGLEGATDPDPRVEWAWKQIVVNQGDVRVRGLANELGWSQGHLIRTFRHQLGLTPKKLARIARFNAVLRASGKGESRESGMSWAELAATHGYADQSHLIRDFREFTGTTPTRLGTLD